MIAPLTAEQIGELEKLLEKATPGPWERDTCGSVADNTYEVLTDADGKVIADTGNGGLCVIEYECWEDEYGTHCTWWDDMGRRNFKAIAALRNASPALIAMAKRVPDLEELADGLEKHGDAECERAEKAEAERDKFRAMAVRLAPLARRAWTINDSPQAADDIAALLEEVSHD